MIEIRNASSEGDYQEFAKLCREYVDWCRERYKETSWFVDEVFGYQSLDDELKILATKYGPPNGKTLLAIRDGQIVGGGAYRRTSEEVCEMKRLYVSDKAKGQGIGQQLCEALLASAKAEGFLVMQLDTGNLLTEAIVMYRRMGFAHCAPYHTYPDRLIPYLVFMQKQL